MNYLHAHRQWDWEHEKGDVQSATEEALSPGEHRVVFVKPPRASGGRREPSGGPAPPYARQSVEEPESHKTGFRLATYFTVYPIGCHCDV